MHLLVVQSAPLITLSTDHAWCWQFTRVMHAVMTATSGAKPPTYAKVFELDRRIRDFPVPPALRIPCGPQEKKVEPIALTMQRLLVTVHKETSKRRTPAAQTC